MKTFNYVYINKDGQQKDGAIDALDLEDAHKQLYVRNMILIDVKEAKSAATIKSGKKTTINGKVNRRELIEFCIHMGTLVDAGMSLTSALNEFTSEIQNQYFKHIISKIKFDVENGETMSDGIAMYPRVFSREFVQLIKAGERTGTLPSSFRELRAYLEWLERLSGDIKQATTYPAFVSVALCCFVLYLFSSVIPKITAILIDMNVPLPLVTKVIIAMSTFAIHSWPFLIAAGISIPLIVKFTIRKSERAAMLLDKVKLDIPLFGNLLRLIVQARFAQNFSILHRAGIPILQNLELCQGFIGNRLFEQALKKTLSDVQEGIMLSESLRKSGLFSGLVIRMFAVGEASGNLQDSLKHAADYYNEEVPRKVKRVFGVMEPLIVIVLIGVIGTVAMAIFLPILSISQGLK